MEASIRDEHVIMSETRDGGLILHKVECTIWYALITRMKDSFTGEINLHRKLLLRRNSPVEIICHARFAH